MRIEAKARWMQKPGNTPEEYDDAFGHSLLANEANARTEFHCAIADGATESAYAGLWARLLVRQYCRRLSTWDQLDDKDLLRIVSKAARTWYWCVAKKNHPWFIVDKVAEGAHSTLAGLSIRACDPTQKRGWWYSLTFGDSCIMQVRDGRLYCWLPVEKSRDFSNHPLLLSTQAQRNAVIWDNLAEHFWFGDWLEGDQFWLMTDAVAAWVLREVEAQNEPWLTLNAAITTREAFAEWVEGESRGANRLRHDDLTVANLRIFGA